MNEEQDGIYFIQRTYTVNYVALAVVNTISICWQIYEKAALISNSMAINKVKWYEDKLMV